MTHIISSKDIFGPHCSWPYNVLRHINPGVFLDVGAAKGSITKRMAKASPRSSIIAYEPFPGNWPLFQRETESLTNCRLVRKAVSDATGAAYFRVSSVVTGSENGWKDSIGYSSVGHIVDKKDEQTIDVETVAIDDEDIDHIRFLKIDVQGHEQNVLAGCAGMLERYSIDMILMECDGNDPEIIIKMMNKGFICFDSGFCITTNALSDENWTVSYESTLSTGHHMFGGWPSEYPRTPNAFCGWMRKLRSTIGYSWTDLLFVSPHFVADFMVASSTMVKVQTSEKLS